MSRAFWFLFLFVAWCMACAIWYMFGVKGISTDIHYFQPEARLFAIIEILIMLIVASMIGLGIGWFIREKQIFRQRENLVQLSYKCRDLNRIKAQKSAELEEIKRSILTHQQEFAQQNSLSKNSIELTKQDLADIGLQLSETRREKVEIAQRLEKEILRLNQQINQYQSQLFEKEQVIEKLKREVERARNQKIEITPNPFIRTAEISEKDDLTKIKGIGPFIEKRLNMIGIFTFKQLSELTPEMIEHIGPAIEFFPHRIIKDNWVGQASRFI